MRLSFSYAATPQHTRWNNPNSLTQSGAKLGAINLGVFARLLLGQMVGVAVSLAEKLAITR